jgi:hypothetical protein
MYQRWDIWLAAVQYEETDAYKPRPVLVISVWEHVYVFALKMTSHAPRDHCDYALKSWQSAGLAKETTVRLSKRLVLHEDQMIHKIGKLDWADVEAIKALDRMLKSESDG